MSLTPTGRPADRTQAGAAYARIEEMIVTLELAPGEVVTETRLRELTGMGRTPVREALLQLKQDFLLSVMPREGILIRPIEVSVALDALEGRVDAAALETQQPPKKAKAGYKRAGEAASGWRSCGGKHFGGHY